MEIKAKILKLVQTEKSDLPTLPIVVNKIISVASDTNSTVDELANVISYDQAMTSKLLKLSNSIYFAQKTRVETIKRAISVIGYDEIVGIALAVFFLQIVPIETVNLSILIFFQPPDTSLEQTARQ